MLRVAALIVLLVAALSRVVPPPVHEEYHGGQLQLSHVCNIYLGRAEINGIDANYYLAKVLTRLNRGLTCQKPVLVQAKESTQLHLTHNQALKPEGYELRVDQEGIHIAYSQYSGYVYALETFWQLVEDGGVKHCFIKDEP